MEPPHYLRYFIRLTLHSLPEGTLSPYEISQAAYDWLLDYIAASSIRKAKRPTSEQLSFLWIETVEGINVLVLERDIEMLRLSSHASSTLPPSPPARFEETGDDYDERKYGPIGRVEIYLRGRAEPIITSTFDEPAQLAMYFTLLGDPGTLEMYLEDEGDLIYFIDDDGEEVGLRLDRLMLLAAHPGSLDFGFDDEAGDTNDANRF